jgi:hypothetical protein
VANNKIKLLKLIAFNKTYSKLRIFLVNIEMYIKVNQIKDNKKKIIFIVLYFINTITE